MTSDTLRPGADPAPSNARTRRLFPATVLGRAGLCAMAGLLLGHAPVSFGVSRIILEVGEISAPGVRAVGTAVSLDLRPEPDPAIRVRSDKLELGSQLGTYRQVDVYCPSPLINGLTVGCLHGTISALGGPTEAVNLTAATTYDRAAESLSFTGNGLALAGGHLRFSGQLDGGSRSLEAEAKALDLVKLRALVAPWFTLPEGYSVGGRTDVRATLTERHGVRNATFAADVSELDFSNPEGTVLTEKVAASLTGQWTAGDVDLRLDSAHGQALAGQVLLDFGVNPLTLTVKADSNDGQTVRLHSVEVSQKDLMTANAHGELTLKPQPSLTSAHIDVTNLTLPAAYRSFAQLTLAGTDFGSLTSTGHVTAAVDIDKDSITRIDAHLNDINLEDPKNAFSLVDVKGELHWLADARTAVETSHIAWTHGSAYGLNGAGARLTFTARDRDFELLGDTRLPIFDGAIVIHTLAAHNLGTDAAQVNFDGEIEPISMPLLSKAFGWPELSGRLAGRIPGVHYRDRTLVVEGDIAANVFNGTIMGSRFRLQDPLGPWPRLFADVTARGLDLDLVTHTFAIGSITGLLSADIKGLELFNWSPVAFDASLYTTPGDRSKHLISQKAVTSISNVGGGGGGVAAALQSGLLRFFDTFHYDRLGVRCQLRNDVCLMEGIEPVHDGAGYYLVKGGGIPRIDIIGNAGRVDWRTLMNQISASMRSQNVVVR